MKLNSAQRAHVPAAAPQSRIPEPTPPAPVNESAAITVERRRGETGAELRTTVTITAADGSVTHERTEWKAQRRWLPDHEMVKRLWVQWLVGDTARQVFKR